MRLGMCLSVLVFFQLSATPAAIPDERIASQASAKSTKDSSDLLLPPSEDLSRAWDEIGGKLVEMAQDFPEDKYDFKVQKDQRTFAETILHIANDDFLAITAVKGSQAGPDFHGEHPSRAVYKSKADVVKLLKDAVAAGSAVIKAQGDAGLDKAIFSPFTADPVRVSTLWWSVIEDDGEHYGQLVVYYRANNLVPPRSR
ncbi:MAG: DinB family protein [Candidatus Acidiferrales bacterium]|jgi:hypothetical protein